MYPYDYFTPYNFYFRNRPPGPPFGMPGGGGFFPPGGGMGPGGGMKPGGSMGPGGTPMGPPPSFTPSKSDAGPSLKAVDPGSIRFCRYKFTYIWLRNGRSFWSFITFVGRKSISGYRWQRRRGWVYFGMDLRKIDSFICY